ncbi:MAG: DUF3293 domain-containing protein [Dokdonella sp.]
MTPHETSAEVNELVALYRRSHYDVVLPDAHRATLRIGEIAPPAIAEWIGADAFALYLTACNPYSMALTTAQNDERLVRLRARLHAQGARWLEGHAGVPGETWFEPSLLIAGLALAQGDRLAFEYEQNAGVWVDVVQPARLRVYRPDWRKLLAAAPDIDWIER